MRVSSQVLRQELGKKLALSFPYHARLSGVEFLRHRQSPVTPLYVYGSHLSAAR